MEDAAVQKSAPGAFPKALNEAYLQMSIDELFWRLDDLDIEESAARAKDDYEQLLALSEEKRALGKLVCSRMQEQLARQRQEKEDAKWALIQVTAILAAAALILMLPFLHSLILP